MNQDGRSNGLTAPNPQAQRAVLRDAYKHAGVSPGAVQYIEAHGTGTRLGDPMELRALGRVLETDRAPGEMCAVGSVKTNIGHLESAAGVAGLIKTALALHHEAIPASLHFEEANTLIPFDKLPLRVQDGLVGWPRGPKARYAGVSAFGIGGTNAHLVLEEGPAHEGVVMPEPAVFVLPMSARSREALVALARAYVESLSGGALRGISLGDVCYTASVRRDHFEHRLCVVGRTRAALVGRLEAFLRGEDTAAPTTTSEELAARYTRGEEVDFRARQGVRRAHVTLPSYPWQRSRHWLESAPAEAPAAFVAASSREIGAVHPLLERHIHSASGELLWEVEVSRDTHGFLQDHVLGGARVFPGLAYVEMALAAATARRGARGRAPSRQRRSSFLAAGFVPDDDAQTVQLSLAPDDGRGAAFRILSRPRRPSGSPAATPWTLHARGKIVRETDADTVTFDARSAARCNETLKGKAFYESLRATGTAYGPRFQGVTSIVRRTGEALSEIEVPLRASRARRALPSFSPALLRTPACADPARNGVTPGIRSCRSGPNAPVCTGGLVARFGLTPRQRRAERRRRSGGHLRAYDGGKLVAGNLGRAAPASRSNPHA